MILFRLFFPGLPKRNPGLEFANAFSVKERICILVNSFLLTTLQQFCKSLFRLCGYDSGKLKLGLDYLNPNLLELSTS